MFCVRSFHFGQFWLYIGFVRIRFVSHCGLFIVLYEVIFNSFLSLCHVCAHAPRLLCDDDNVQQHNIISMICWTWILAHRNFALKLLLTIKKSQQYRPDKNDIKWRKPAAKRYTKLYRSEMSLFVKMIRQKLATQHLSCMHFYRWDDGCGGDFSRELNMNHFYYKELNAVCPIWKLNKCFRWEWKIYWRPFTDYILDRLNEIVQQQKNMRTTNRMGKNGEQKERESDIISV